MRSTVLAALVFTIGCTSSTSVRLSITDKAGAQSAAPLELSIFDPHHALVEHAPLGDKALPLVAVAYNLPASAEQLRLVITRVGSPMQLGSVTSESAAKKQVDVAVVVAAGTPDRDGDGVPDLVDNCPAVANPDQASASGGAGDACSTTRGGDDGGTHGDGGARGDMSATPGGGDGGLGSDGGTGDMAHTPTLTLLVGALGGNGSADGTTPVARLSEPTGLALVGDSVYITENTGALRKLDLATNTLSTIALVDGVTGVPISELDGPTGLIYDGATYLYVADNNSWIRRIKVSNGAVYTFAGTDTGGYKDGAAATAQFNHPNFMAFDASGNLWVTDSVNQVVRMITMGASPTVSTVAGQPNSNAAADGSGGTTGTARFSDPYQITIRGTSVYVSDLSSIRKIDTTLAATSTSYVTTAIMPGIFGNVLGLAPGPTAGGTDIYSTDNDYVLRDVTPGAPPSFPVVAGVVDTSGAKDGLGTGALLKYPAALISDGSGNYYFNDEATLRTLVSGTGKVTTLAGTATHDGYSDTPPSLLSNPLQLIYDGNDTVYFCDYSNDRVRAYSLANNTTSLVAGSGSLMTSDGTGDKASFSGPSGLALDGSGNLWVSEQYGNAIRKIALSTKAVTTVVPASNEGPPPLFFVPYDMVFDGNRTMYIADLGNNRIRAIDTMTNAVSVFAGDGTEDDADNVVGLSAQLNNPYGLAIDRAHQILYVADLVGYTVRKIDLAAAAHPVTTLAGLADNPGFVNGAFADARFSWPRSLAFDAAGNALYLSDGTNSMVRKLDLTTQQVSTFIGDGTQSTIPGPLPAKINSPSGLVMTPRGLIVASYVENALLLAH